MTSFSIIHWLVLLTIVAIWVAIAVLVWFVARAVKRRG